MFNRDPDDPYLPFGPSNTISLGEEKATSGPIQHTAQVTVTVQ